MKSYMRLSIILYISFFAAPLNAQVFTSLSPIPGSKYINPQSSIIIRCSDAVDTRTLNRENFHLLGSVSGPHSLKIKWISKYRTLVICPETDFLDNEEVLFNYNGLMKTTSGKSFPEIDFRFFTSVSVNYDMSPLLFSDSTDKRTEPATEKSQKVLLMSVLVNDNPAPGRIFFSNISNLFPANRSYAIVENDATPILYVEDPKLGMGFTLQKNGYLSCYSRNDSAYIVFDSAYRAIDTFRCANGYKADQHEFQLLEDNHSLLLAYDNQIVDMSVIVPGGEPNAIVTGCIIQELDENKNLIFQWRSWDHFQILDAEHQIFTSSNIDYCHINSVEKDVDGNYIISSRNMDEITKIDHITGDIIWRMGGKNNEFTFVNDSVGFCSQHDARRIGNGHLTLFDNGNYHVPQESSAKEYELDEINKIATLVWSYKHPNHVYGKAMGNVQRLPNGNTVIGWGWCLNSDPFITEVRPDGSISYEASLDHFGDFTYRAFRFEWAPSSNSVQPKSFNHEVNIFPNPADNEVRVIYDKSIENKNIIMQIRNTEGRVVFYKQVLNEETINISFLKSGFYIVTLLSTSMVQSYKLMIFH